MRTTYWMRKPGHNTRRALHGLLIGAIVIYWTKADVFPGLNLRKNALAQPQVKQVSYYYENGQVDSDEDYFFPNEHLFKRVSKTTFLASLL